MARRKGFAQSAGQFRVVVFPDAHAGLDLSKVDGAVGKRKFDKWLARGLPNGAAILEDLIDTAALFVIDGPATVEGDAVATLNGPVGELDDHAVFSNPTDMTEQDAALGGADGGDEHFVIATAKPAGREAAGER